MQTFTFNLEKILIFEINQKKQIEKELADIRQKIAEIEQKIKDLLAHIQQTNIELKNKMQQGTETSTIVMYRAYLNTLSNQLAELKREQERQEFFQREVLIKLKKQNIEIKKMEKLKQKQFEEFTKQQEKEQEQLIEEFVCIQRHH